MITTRRSFLQSSAVTALGLGIFHENVIAALLSDDLTYKMAPLRGSVGYFTERGGTIGWMISKDGIVIIDTQFPDQSKHLIAKIKEKTDRKVDLLINTHHHGDHSSGNIAFKELADIVLAHENSRKNQIMVAKERNQESGQLYPDTTFSEVWSKKVGGETVTLRYFGPGHTDGDAIIHFENANIVHMGDLVFNRRYPYIDKGAGASVKNWIQVLDRTLKTFDNDTKYIFGHSGNGYDIIGTREDLLAMENYLSSLMEVVNTAIKNGKSEEDIMKMESIEGSEEWEGNGIERSLSAAYQELSAE